MRKPACGKSLFKNILVIRTDRMGDVLLSTPVIKALKQEFPSSRVSMMVSPYTAEILDGNPWLDEVILYDKAKRHKGPVSTVKFALQLKKKQFDLAVVLHPTTRVHILTFLAGIPRRVGYLRKMGFLLNTAVPDTKCRGEKHETEYCLELLRTLGIQPFKSAPYLPIKAEAELCAGRLFSDIGIRKGDFVVALHPGASCRSRRWPPERFAQLGDIIAQKYGARIVIIAGHQDLKCAAEVCALMKYPVDNLAGKTSISVLNSVIKRCSLLITNDSGPMHLASALQVPVVVIFARKQAGLSVRRWGPLGDLVQIVKKDIGCAKCLAHYCKKGFACLMAVSVDDVLAAFVKLKDAKKDV